MLRVWIKLIRSVKSYSGGQVVAVRDGEILFSLLSDEPVGAVHSQLAGRMMMMMIKKMQISSLKLAF